MRAWLLYSNLHIIPVAAGFVLGTYALSGAQADFEYVVLATCGAFVVYQWDRVSGLSPEDLVNIPGRRQWLLRHPVYLVFSTAAAIAGCVWAISDSTGFVRGAAAVLGLIGLAYAVPLILGHRPKEVAGLKNVMIAFCWIAGGVAVPLADAQVAPAVIVWLSIHRLIYIIPNLFLADLVDRHGDLVSGVRNTIARGAGFPDHRSALHRETSGRGVTGSSGRWVALASLAAAIAVSVISLTAGVPPEGSVIWPLLFVDLAGLGGIAAILVPTRDADHSDVVHLDAWVGYPLVTWLVSLFL